MTVSVAIPVRDGGVRLEEVLAAVRAQRAVGEVDLVVVDSASRDGSAALARSFGARVESIAAADFSHGRTRNRLMELARGEHVAFLTQDAVPASARWLRELLDGFAAAPRVALAFGPYLPVDGASPMVARELAEWFARMAPVVRGPRVLTPGPEGFFSDVNGAVARWAWEQVPYRPVSYAEDRLLAADVLAHPGGWATAYQPGAAVIHSHAYRSVELLRRAFDEARALREIYGHLEPLDPRTVVPEVARAVCADVRIAAPRWAPRSAAHHTIRSVGAALGSRAGGLPPGVRRALSLERRATFEPLAWPPAP